MVARVSCLVVGLALACGCAKDGGPPINADAKKTAKAQADECQTAMLKGDYEKLMDFTHPKIVEGMGGREKMREKMSSEIAGMKAKGFTFKSVTVHDPAEPVSGGKELYIAVPFTLEIAVPDGRLLAKSTLIGVSSDGGKAWTFADTAPGRAALKKVFPDLPESLVIPKKEEPTFVKD